MGRPTIPASIDIHLPDSGSATGWELLRDAANAIPDPVRRNTARWELLRDRAKEVLDGDGRILEQQTAIKAIADDLGFRLNGQEISRLCQDLEGRCSAYEAPVMPGQVFEAPAQQWFLEGLVLHDLNLLVGMPGSGKSVFLVALIRAWLDGQSTFLQRALLDGRERSVLLIGTDQNRQQWGALLEQQGLAIVVDQQTAADGTEQLAYQLHKRIELHTSGGGFRLDGEGLRYIKRWNAKHPGGLVVVDSLSAVLPDDTTENDPAAGRLMRRLEEARHGNPMICTHHSKKQAAMDGELGVYTGSGHGSIDRAVSRHLGLGYELHRQDGREVLHVETNRRVLTSQKRGGGNVRLIVEMGPRGCWDYVSTAAEDRAMRRQEEQGDPEDRLRGRKREVYVALKESGTWMDSKALCAALGKSYERQGSDATSIRRAAQELVDKEGLAERNEQGMGGLCWRLKAASPL